MRCPDCGYPTQEGTVVCPKCDHDYARSNARVPYRIDLAHRGETVDRALEKLDRAVSDCLWRGHPSLLVIHGYGSGGSHASIKPHIIAALKRYATRYGASVRPCPDNPGSTVLDFHLR